MQASCSNPSSAGMSGQCSSEGQGGLVRTMKSGQIMVVHDPVQGLEIAVVLITTKGVYGTDEHYPELALVDNTGLIDRYTQILPGQYIQVEIDRRGHRARRRKVKITAYSRKRGSSRVHFQAPKEVKFKMPRGPEDISRELLCEIDAHKLNVVWK